MTVPAMDSETSTPQHAPSSASQRSTNGHDRGNHGNSGTGLFLLMVSGGGLVAFITAVIGVGRGEFHLLWLVIWSVAFGWFQIPLLALALSPSFAAQRRHGSGLRQATTQGLYWGTAVMMGLATATVFINVHVTWCPALAAICLLVLTAVNGSRLAAGRPPLFHRSG